MQFTMTTTSGLERRIEVAIPHTRVAGEVERRLRCPRTSATWRERRQRGIMFDLFRPVGGRNPRGCVTFRSDNASFG